MKILILGGDGYLGWPTAMRLSRNGHDVFIMDNYLRRQIAKSTQSDSLLLNPDLAERIKIFESVSGQKINYKIGDCAKFQDLAEVFSKFMPDAVVHYAEQPSAPFSMQGIDEASLTLNNNLNSTLNLIWSVLKFKPNCHIVKLGTMGEYGTPNIDIEEGWIDINHNGRVDKFLFPRQAGSLYHTTKVLDTDLLWFYVRTYNLSVTDLMQGPVYGISTSETDLDDRLATNFSYDDIFGTVVNRFLIQAIANVPLTIYGNGGQTRGYLNLQDTLQCVELAINSPAKNELRILNQFTELLSVRDIANKLKNALKTTGINVEIQNIKNPRKEKEDHYYHAKNHGLIELGLKPHFMTDNVILEMYYKLEKYSSKIDISKILPRVDWNNS